MGAGVLPAHVSALTGSKPFYFMLLFYLCSSS